MKLYIKVFIIVISSILAIVLLSKSFLKGYYKFNYQYQFKQVEEAITGQINYDIVFLGTSRTFNDIDPHIIDSISQQNSYNFGITAGRLTEINMMLKLYLEHHTAPKMMVLDLTLLTLNNQHQQFFNPNRYYPYMHDSVIYNTIGTYKKAWLLKNIPALRITEIDDFGKGNAIMGMMGKVDQGAPLYKGYVPKGTNSIKPCVQKKIDSTNFILTEQSNFLLQQMADICKRKKIKFIISYYPTYDCFEYTGNRSDFFEYLIKFSKENDAIFLNYEKWMATNHNYFSDHLHLNKQGSKEFSKLLITDILKINKN